MLLRGSLYLFQQVPYAEGAIGHAVYGKPVLANGVLAANVNQAYILG